MLSMLHTLIDSKLSARFVLRPLVFNKPSGTSRGVLTEKACWYLIVENEHGQSGIGECSPIWGLSPENPDDYEPELQRVVTMINDFPLLFEDGTLDAYPSIKFGLETALLDLSTGGRRTPYPSPLTEGADGIRINGLIWMGSREYMLGQIMDKLKAGNTCLKLKIGAIDWQTEMQILEGIRQQFSSNQLELRVDANGAFSTETAAKKLQQLASLQIHSIEQPIQAGNWEAMAALCKSSRVPIALDEELIGVHGSHREELLDIIHPHYIILKPSLLGGIEACEQWIKLAEERNIGWWVTSMLESNLGLNTIAQWTYTLNNPLPQGLGTGQLFTNNPNSPLYLDGEHLKVDPTAAWDLDVILG